MGKDHRRYCERQLERVRRKEEEFFARRRGKKRYASALMKRVEKKIPAMLVNSMDEAFYRAFQILFEKGTWLVRLTIAEKRLRAQRFIREYYLKEKPDAGRVDAFYKSARAGGMVSTLLATGEGFIMGLLGMGLPDIPILMSLLLRTVYQTALRYGFRYDSQQERYFILLVLSAALTGGAEQAEYSAQADQVGRAMDRGERLSVNLEEQMRCTSAALARSMLVPKFIQTYSIVGVIGGLNNFSVSRKVANMANLKYQRRFLERKVQER